MKIAFTGDIVLQGADKLSEEYFLSFTKQVDMLDAALCVNLESPFITSESVAEKNKIVLGAAEESSKHLDCLNPMVVNLGNNHINDYGNNSCELTFEVLKNKKINFFGAGSKPEANDFIVFKECVLLSFCCRTSDLTGERLYADDENYGVYPVSFARITQIKKEFPNKTLVLNIHWGVEDIYYPEVAKRKLARKLIDTGVDLIVGHHPHIIQPFEIYKGRYIFYSLGNFYFPEIDYELNGMINNKKPLSHQRIGIVPIVDFSGGRISIKNILRVINQNDVFHTSEIKVSSLGRLISPLLFYSTVNKPYVYYKHVIKYKISQVVMNPNLIVNKINKIFSFMSTSIKNIILNNFLSDELFTYYRFYKHHGYIPKKNNPKTLNEILQWLKLNDRRPLITMCADKLKVREYVKNKVGGEILIPLLKVFDDVRECNDILSYPDKPFVIKANHNSGGVFICEKPDDVNLSEIYDKALKWMGEDYYKVSKEWQYKNIERKIFIEELVLDDDGALPFDYKFHCINGKVEFISVDIDRFSNHKRNIYDRQWKILPFTWSAKDSDGNPLWPNGREVNKPSRLEDMIEIAEKLAIKFAYVRIDLYLASQDIYFGEMTMHHGSGFENIKPFKWDLHYGKLLGPVYKKSLNSGGISN